MTTLSDALDQLAGAVPADPDIQAWAKIVVESGPAPKAQPESR